MWFLPIVPGSKKKKTEILLEKWSWNICILPFPERSVQPTISYLHEKDHELRYEIM
jgi:hypothetical protein